MIKRFALFAYDDYYPGGGWADFVDSFETWEEAQHAADKRKPWRDNKQIIDLTTGEDVYKP